MNSVKIGLLGLGTVGGGTVNVLKRNAAEITRRAGCNIEVAYASARDLNKPRICETTGIELTTQSSEIVENPDVDIV
ncbi:MAG TPA: homoserine dehydrogenase, partial [Ectothiorhodospiraceae bacterium]|nr:homoserine dehydrogenase [Ectothiorhodospiraceae bacterium]